MEEQRNAAFTYGIFKRRKTALKRSMKGCPMVRLPDEVREVAPVLRVDVIHVLLEDLAADLHLPLQARLVAGSPEPGHRGLRGPAVVGWKHAEISRAEHGWRDRRRGGGMEGGLCLPDKPFITDASTVEEDSKTFG